MQPFFNWNRTKPPLPQANSLKSSARLNLVSKFGHCGDVGGGCAGSTNEKTKLKIDTQVYVQRNQVQNVGEWNDTF